ncbi:ABC transporter ATP-binding protein [Taibaiella soli]|uniref:ABC transporter ATP-binding protein n=1 Tax=Taibaiella soli TaxID=1649169 RepID=A0A2W2BFB7_9BACT|nr:ABC transporter ATP-binding protein [Taibaiella soli]PZF74909.1 ABC transporter ATP-binding protein [Taibaiella soli]
MYCIETKQLSFKYSGGAPVLQGIDLQVPEGCIYGFLGPNGAGKTTTLRLLLGLLKKQEGAMLLFGKEFERNRIEILQKTGSLIEAPSLYSHLTARENLDIMRYLYDFPPKRIDAVLDLAGLGNVGSKTVGKFSLGMKQRLSIAIALLHQPELLILDEPTNGLDPNGIIEMRELLKALNKEYKTTILISSHLLSEIEKLVTHIGIINKGQLLFQGTLEDLQRKQKQGASTIFHTGDAGSTMRILQENGLQPVLADGMVLIPLVDRSVIAGINQQLVAEGVVVFEISSGRNDLESIFIDLVNN